MLREKFMKKLLMIVVALVTAAALFTSCGGSGDPDAGGGSGGGGGGGYSGGGGGGGASGGGSSTSGGDTTTTTIDVPYIFAIDSLTEDCSESDFSAFFDTPGNYECQYIYSMTEFVGTTYAVLTYNQKAEYTITKASYDEYPETNFTKASSTLYIKTQGVASSSAQTDIRNFYEPDGYTVTFNGDTATCVKNNDLENADDIPLTPSTYRFKKTCKMNADGSKVYITIEPALDTEAELLIAKK